MSLKRIGLNLRSVFPKGKTFRLLDNANLSSGGMARDVTKNIHHSFNETAICLTHDMGLRYCGVDLMVAGDITAPPQQGKWWVIETNAAPGIDHYAASGRRQKQIVNNMYFKVLLALKNLPR